MIQVICFSRARPLQIHGYLTSLSTHWTGVRVSVLVRVDELYASAYQQVQAEFPQVTWRHETDFRLDLAELIDPEIELTCFGCDDVVATAPVESAVMVKMLAQETSVLGWSLRLGAHIRWDMFGAPMAQPTFTREAYVWDFTAPDSVGDWAYPWEVAGTVYRTEFVKCMVDSLGANSPSQLEERGSRGWAPPAGLRRHMAAFGTSRLVVPTVNVIQHEFPNGIKGAKPLSPEFLLECWNNGLRLDTERYAGMTPESWRVPEFFLKRVT